MHGHMNIKFLDRFSKNTQMSNFMKIRPVGAELFRTDRQTFRHDEVHCHFSQFCERAWHNAAGKVHGIDE